jgi:hypothetical protein
LTNICRNFLKDCNTSFPIQRYRRQSWLQLTVLTKDTFHDLFPCPKIISPKLGVWDVGRHNIASICLNIVGKNHMQGTTLQKIHHKATGIRLIIWVFFNDLAISNHYLYVSVTNLPKKHLLDRVTGKNKFLTIQV